jgi:hypothetical protein
MKLQEANAELEKIIAESGDTVYCLAERDSYGKPISIALDGEFTPEQISRIAEIASKINHI